ncbi:hypothetical protein FT663_02232 [Candidozyma haemuli var. vulneris]|uniref:MMS19 nucleotide excision repair protein n=1 Tax=Candidozyma haemuli TaxID=45357 RepID=A0A2V1AT05_9ASCO|nr:hypothetical protein CXQ85_000188 [[Candida] haemuloni]KAF3992579.1 hypothetical protein FT663_02232 [[Candida] haemuloni var. vulneris]PVH21220.1 hypothetical protein CXQ85_000188 [[Candida] haemuloni]
MSASNDAPTLVNQFIASVASGESSSEAPQKLSERLASGSLTLLQFIQVLGPSLTSDDPTTRSYAVNCLSSTLELSINTVRLTNQDVNVLVQFLVRKFEDEKLTIHILAALTSLVQFKKFLPHVNDNFTTLVKAVTDVYEPRKHLAKVRYEAFNLLSTLLKSHEEAIFTNPEFSETFIKAFIHVASGEKDPRNLLMSFRLNMAINEKFQFQDRTTNSVHDGLLTELFDVCFCYFPISFSPPANDPYKITASDLKLELRKTIASQTQFAQDTFPSLFEKLTSTNPSVRNDVLQTLYLCVTNYSASTIEQYWVTIWEALKFEILHNDVSIFQPQASYIIPPDFEAIDDTDDNKTLILTLKTLSGVAEKLSGSEESVKSLVETVKGDLKSNLESEDSKTVKQSTLLICSLGSVSVPVYNGFVDFLFSFDVWGKYVRSDLQEEKQSDDDMEIDVSLTVARQRDLIDNLGFVFSANLVLGSPTRLLEYKDHLLIFLGQLLQTSSKLDKTLKCKITQQLVKLILLKDFLLTTEVSLILGWLNDNLINVMQSGNSGWEKDIFLAEIVNGIVRIMTEGPEDQVAVHVSSVIETILPTLLDNIADTNILDIIKKLCVNYRVLEVLSIRLLNKIDYEDCSHEQLGSIIDCLISSFKQTQSVKPFVTNTWYKNFVPRFLDLIVKKSGDDAAILELSGQLLGLITRYTEKSKQPAILQDIVGKFSGLDETGGESIDVFASPSAKIAILKHVLAKVDKSCSFPSDAHEKIEQSIKLASQANAEFVRMGYLQVIAILVNKFTSQNDKTNGEVLERLFGDFQTDVNSLETATWILKGLIMRSDSVGAEYLNKLLDEVFSSENLGYSKQTSRCFSILMADLDVFSNPENSKVKIISGVVNLNVKLLYKQQIFENILQRVLEKFNTVEADGRKEVLLGTLAIIIGNISTKILKPHLKEVFPLVLNGLSIENATILKASLDTFKVIISESPDLISENIDSLVVKLVDLSTRKIVIGKKLVNDEEIRFLALECLEGIFTSVEIPQIVKYQATTRDKLRVCLDDKKRSVRKKACDVCQILYETGR